MAAIPPAISIVSPVYGCKASLPELYTRLVAALEPITDNFEIILVDDCCPDGSWPVIVQLGMKDERVRGLRLSRNFGRHYSATAGLDVARGDKVVVMDCDLEDRPEEIPRLLAHLDEGYDMVFGRTKRRGERPLLVDAATRLYYRIYGFLADAPEKNFNMSLMVMTRRVRTALVAMRETQRQLLSVVQFLGFRWTAIDVQTDPRPYGTTTFSFLSRIRHAFVGITTGSTKLLRSGIVLGLLCSGSAFGFGIYVIVAKLMIHKFVVYGWSSTAALTVFIGGLNMLLLGIVGIYLEVIFYEVKRRPVYFVGETINIDVPPAGGPIEDH